MHPYRSNMTYPRFGLDFQKRIVTEGRVNILPVDYSQCNVSLQQEVQGSLPDVWCHDDNYALTGEALQLTLGKGNTPLNVIIDLCVLSMKVGEICEMTIHSEESSHSHDGNDTISDTAMEESGVNNNGWSSPKRPRCDQQSMASHEHFKIKITLNSIHEQAPVIFKLTQNEKLDRAHQYKEQATCFFRSSHIELAFGYYGKALKYLICMGKLEDIQSDILEDYKLLKTQCYLNLSACQMQKHNYSGVINNCTKALELDPHNIKGLFRRGQAYSKCRRFCEAEVDLQKALSIEPNNTTVNNVLISIQAQTMNQEENVTQGLKKMFN